MLLLFLNFFPLVRKQTVYYEMGPKTFEAFSYVLDSYVSLLPITIIRQLIGSTLKRNEKKDSCS